MKFNLFTGMFEMGDNDVPDEPPPIGCFVVFLFLAIAALWYIWR